MNPAPRWFLTGASGFVGRALAAAAPGEWDALALGTPGWRERIAAAAFRGTTVFHLAARVHAQGGDDSAWMQDNAQKTEALARAAAAGGARRLVMLSTVKVNGEETSGTPFRASDPPRPQDAYGRSKWEGEQALARVATRAGLEYVIVRSPLVIGPSAKGNLATLLRVADSGWPLPFASIRNRRTFIALDDLVELLKRCAERPVAVGRTFLAGDPDAVSTPRLVTAVRNALGRAARLFGCPPPLLEGAAFVTGQGSLVRRLTRSLEIDVGETMRTLDWAPRRPIDEALREMALAHKAAH